MAACERTVSRVSRCSGGRRRQRNHSARPRVAIPPGAPRLGECESAHRSGWTHRLALEVFALDLELLALEVFALDLELLALEVFALDLELLAFEVLLAWQ